MLDPYWMMRIGADDDGILVCGDCWNCLVSLLGLTPTVGKKPTYWEIQLCVIWGAFFEGMKQTCWHKSQHVGTNNKMLFWEEQWHFLKDQLFREID